MISLVGAPLYTVGEQVMFLARVDPLSTGLVGPNSISWSVRKRLTGTGVSFAVEPTGLAATVPGSAVSPAFGPLDLVPWTEVSQGHEPPIPTWDEVVDAWRAEFVAANAGACPTAPTVASFVPGQISLNEALSKW